MDKDYLDVVFDGPPNIEGPRFIELENSAGKAVRVGKWLRRPDGYWVLRIPMKTGVVQEIVSGSKAVSIDLPQKPNY